jgi:hypothetical protein
MIGTVVHTRRQRVTSRPSRSGEPQGAHDDLWLACRSLPQALLRCRSFEEQGTVGRECSPQEALNLCCVFDDQYRSEYVDTGRSW